MIACEEQLASLAGHVVLITGSVRIAGEHVVKSKSALLIRERGGDLVTDFTSRVTLVVCAQFDARRLEDDRRRLTGKMLDVEKYMHRTGRHVHVINTTGFEDLLSGKSATCNPPRLLGAGHTLGP